jgi:hypothetical protein
MVSRNDAVQGSERLTDAPKPTPTYFDATSSDRP